jgi:hypothetical protein
MGSYLFYITTNLDRTFTVRALCEDDARLDAKRLLVWGEKIVDMWRPVVNG